MPVSHIVQSVCVSCGSFEPCKVSSTRFGEYGKGGGCGLLKLDLKHKVSVGNISAKHHFLKALATSQTSVVHTAKKVSTYRFWAEVGGQVKVLVKKKNDKFEICIELVSLPICEQGEKIMVWGLFRSDSTDFLPLSFSKKSKVETPFVKDAVELELDTKLAPFYLSFQLKSYLGPNSKVSNIRSHRKTDFVVPVGFGSGRPFPLGITFLDDGSINFAIYSRNVDSIVLCLYADATSEKPDIEIDLDPYVNRSGDIWHAWIDGSVPYVKYGYRCKNNAGNKTNHVLLDPYARVIEDIKLGLHGRICKEPAFDWSGEVRPVLPIEKLIVYRLNVLHFTNDKSSKLSDDIRGSFAGVSEKLNHFKDLGVNAILLEPIFPFDKQKGPYFPLHFFSPGSLNGSYGGDSRNVSKSLKEMVKKLHANGIEVLLEVVFSHTAETASMTEIDNSSYYHQSGDIKSYNSLNCNNPIVQEMILESLRHWVIEYHIDGFSFINASSLTRGTHGEFLSRPPLIEAIAFDPLLSKTKIIADLWDPHDRNNKEMVTFPHWKRWAEMNSKFCVDVKNFLKGEGAISNLATRLCGSGDLFLAGRGPGFSFNFITRNLGFTLVDLVSFSNSREMSWNCGEEGPTNKAIVLEIRLRQIRNFLFVLFISLGVPVLNMGDECGQSSCSSSSSLDWNALRSGFGIQVTQFISFLSTLKRRRMDLLQNMSFLKEENIEWHGSDQSPPSWDDPSCQFLAMMLKVDLENEGGDLFIAFNSASHPEEVTLPPLCENVSWVCLVDTGLPYPGFFSFDGVPVEACVLSYEMKPHSCILFEARSL